MLCWRGRRNAPHACILLDQRGQGQSIEGNRAQIRLDPISVPGSLQVSRRSANTLRVFTVHQVKTTSPTVWLAIFVRQRFGVNMKSFNASSTRWVGVLALLCAFLALITPAGKQAVHFNAIDRLTPSGDSTKPHFS